MVVGGFKMKTRIPLWIEQDIINKMDGLYKQENCKSRSEFIENAVQFYIGYILTKDNVDYLGTALTNVIDGRIGMTEDRLSKLIFKICVEVSILMNLYAIELDVDTETLDKLRNKCIKDIKKTNGNINLKNIIDYQNEK